MYMLGWFVVDLRGSMFFFSFLFFFSLLFFFLLFLSFPFFSLISFLLLFSTLHQLVHVGWLETDLVIVILASGGRFQRLLLC